MRVETQHGRKIVCQHIFTPAEITAGQVWQCSMGSTVTVTACDGEDVTYTSNGKTHSKDAFSFQCRYCLVIQ